MATSTSSMFNGASNVTFHNSLLVVNERRRPLSLDKIVDQVAPNAILNAGGRADEVRCFPGTREEVIGKLEKFMDDNTPGKKRMMWLSGPAGAGKSAICQTLAERRTEQGKQAVNFFFFRGDSTRHRSKPLVATLVYQLRAFYPALNEPLSNYLIEDPLICNASIEAQFERLIASPFQIIQQSMPIQHKIVLVIDGLDECNNDEREQDQILVALHTLAHADNSPFLILVSSRAESQLVRSFNRLGSSVESIFLNNDYRPQKDIRHFVVSKFADIKKDHHLAGTLDEKWPTRADIDAIVNKSSGHFIYAATVMRYIEYSPESPALSLVAILEMQPFTDHNPLAHLDAVYSYIFSRARNIRAVRLILFASNCSTSFRLKGEIVPTPLAFGDLLTLAEYTNIHVQSFFGDLIAIIKVVPDTRDPSQSVLQFYHASLEDYLKDKLRSTIYYVHENEIAAELASRCLKNIREADSIRYAVQALQQVPKATLDLTQSFLHASTKYLGGERQVLFLEDLIAQIERLYWGHDNDQFTHLLRHWSHFVHRNKLDDRSYIWIKPQNWEASQYYNQYWLAEGDSEQGPPTLPDSASVAVARSSIQMAPAKVPPNAAKVGNPMPNPREREPKAFPGNDPCNNGRAGSVTGRSGQRKTVTSLDCSLFLSPETTRPVNVPEEEEERHKSREYKDGSYGLRIIRVKIYYQEDIRSMTLTPNAPFCEFVDKVTAKLGKNINDLTVKFRDEDGDKITLCDNAEYDHAIEIAQQSSKGKAAAKLEIWCQDSA